MVHEVILPKLGQAMEEGTIVEWMKEEGDPVQQGEVLFIIESDKATLEVESHADGFLRKILVPAGQMAPALDVVALITSTPDEDVPSYGPPSGGPPETEAAKPALPPTAESGRTRVAERMVRSHRETAPVTLNVEADVTALVRLCRELEEKTADIPIGYNDVLVKLVAHALRKFPDMNAHPQEIDIALAVDTEHGLLAPVVRSADRKELPQVARELRDLVERARSGQALPAELAGSTFTITNLGMYGVDTFTPLINLPEKAILGVGRIGTRPTVVEGQLAIRETVWLSLTFDHRLVDGAPAARFLQYIKHLVENPRPWLTEGKEESAQ